MVWYTMEDSHTPGNTTKVRLYRLFKTTYAIEPYLFILANSHLRKSLCKLWNWMPSTENWNREIPTPSATTNCKHCTVDCVENEIHFLIECQKYPLWKKYLYREVIRMDIIIRFMLIWLARVWLTKSQKTILKGHLVTVMINQNNNTINVPFL